MRSHFSKHAVPFSQETTFFWGVSRRTHQMIYWLLPTTVVLFTALGSAAADIGRTEAGVPGLCQGDCAVSDLPTSASLILDASKVERAARAAEAEHQRMRGKQEDANKQVLDESVPGDPGAYLQPVKANSHKCDAQMGEASVYANKFNGRTTASGEKFSNGRLTAAHPSLPFGTRVIVTNLRRNRSVEVVINDRGPFVKGRIIDLSRAAAKKIGLGDLGNVAIKPSQCDLEVAKGS